LVVVANCMVENA